MCGLKGVLTTSELTGPRLTVDRLQLGAGGRRRDSTKLMSTRTTVVDFKRGGVCPESEGR